MPEGTESLPPDIEAELARLLQLGTGAFENGIERLQDQRPSLAAAIRAWASAIRLFRGQVPATGPKGSAAIEADDGDPRPGDRVGPFTILSLIGSGGMGTVFLAEQRDPVRRRVALKMIKLGMDSRAMLARFEVERQALAMMDHAAIAKVLEAGITPQGRSFFAMEYVKGVPITTYCDENRLPVEERLALFRQVCGGVQHAHQKGVIHRDLTPGNVLVTTQDGKPSPKIIDFGLARATDQRLTEKTLFTVQGVILGTPEYMSPEQAGLSGLDVDMRTDVYALGVLLYELLTSHLPFERDSLREVGYEAMCRTIREQDPPRPSTRITTLGTGEVAARLRRTSSGALLDRLRGDLDWIVMKCLEKDRTRRYDTVSELSADVQRHLDCEPVLARAPSLRYRLGKLARRHRGQLLAVCVIALSLLAGLVGTTTFWLDARVQARAATRARENEATRAREAGTQAELARSVIRFLSDDLFGAVSPEQAQGREITVREIVDEAAGRLDSALAQQPAVRAELQRVLGEIYARIGSFAEAEKLLAAALEEQRRLANGGPTSGLALALHSLGMYHGDWARDRIDLGVELVQEAIAVHGRLPDARGERVEPWLLELEAMRAHARGMPAADVTPFLRLIAKGRGKQQSDDEVLAFLDAFRIELDGLVRTGRRAEASARLRRELAPFLAKKEIAGLVPWGLAGYASKSFDRQRRDFWLFVMAEAVAISNEINGPGSPWTLGCERILCTFQLDCGQIDDVRRTGLDVFRRSREFLHDRHAEPNILAQVVVAAEAASGSARADVVAEVAAFLEERVGDKPLPDARARSAVQAGTSAAIALLTRLARGVLEQEGAGTASYAQAETLVQQADRLTQSRDARIVDLLALAAHRLGRTGQAIALAAEAVELATNDRDRVEFTARLRALEAAAK